MAFIQYSRLRLRLRLRSGSWLTLLRYAELTAGDTSYKRQLECGPMPNVMVALSNIGGALCSTPQTLADAHY